MNDSSLELQEGASSPYVDKLFTEATYQGGGVMKLGNVYLVAAVTATAMLNGAGDGHFALTMDEAGELRATPEQSEAFADAVRAPGFVGLVSNRPDPEALAARIARVASRERT